VFEFCRNTVRQEISRSEDLDARGFAVIGELLTARDCRTIASFANRWNEAMRIDERHPGMNEFHAAAKQPNSKVVAF
jgi:hypothetical protein